MTEESVHPAKPRYSRRRFLRHAMGGTVLAGLGSLGYAHWMEPYWVETVHQRLPIAALPDSLVGRRLVQISDIHAGPEVDQQYLLQAVAELARLKPDMLAITGDFMTCEADEEVDRALEVLQRLPKPPLGSFAVLGNHDYGRHCTSPTAANLITRGMENLGIEVLRNRVTDVKGLQIAGLDDLYAGRCISSGTLAQLQHNRPALALCHNPDVVDIPSWQSFKGWILAGHTHGGQCRLPWMDPPVIPVRNQRYTAGKIPLAEGRTLYINRGLGYFHQIRFNCRPEVTVFTLEREAIA